MTFVAQLRHDADRLDLGRRERVLFVFECEANPGECASWEGGSGANSCFVVEGSALAEGLTAAPDPSVQVDCEVRVATWEACEDGIDADAASRFYTDKEYLEVPEEVVRRVTQGTRVGSVPNWLQSADESPGPEWRFVAQFEPIHRFKGSPPVVPGVSRGCQKPWWKPWQKSFVPGRDGAPHVMHALEDGQWGVDGSNFGEGIAYVFVRRDPADLSGYFFWQR